jgi:uncharacterized membrane protein YccF (DUF307 family)
VINFLKTAIANMLFFILVGFGWLILSYLVVSMAYGMIIIGSRLLWMIF